MEFAGEFETHVTVQCAAGVGIELLRLWGIERNLKFLHILLDRGEFTSQPMLTRGGRGFLSDELLVAARTSRELEAAGFRVMRVKVEAAPSNEDVPQTSADAAAQPRERYFEHHVKLLLPSNADLTALTALAETHSAHLSRNIRRRRDDGLHERFVTQRCRFLGKLDASERLNALLDGIHSTGHAVLEIEQEYVVYDNNLDLDAGWIVLGT